MFQLILNPIRDWNLEDISIKAQAGLFQLILNPIRDWNLAHGRITIRVKVPINLKPY